MKKITFLLAVTVLFITAKTNAQDDANRECQIKYNLFKGDFKSKKYDDAYANWTYLMENCKDLSVNIYKYGADLAQDVKKDPALAKKVYEQRLQYFSEHHDVKNNLAKAHSDYATYLAKNKLASEAEIFNILEKVRSYAHTVEYISGSGEGSRRYIEEGEFKKRRINLHWQEYEHPVYNQLFNGFMPYLSVIDLLFNEGKESYKLI